MGGEGEAKDDHEYWRKQAMETIEEHRRRKGDPTIGGSTRKPIMTAYRQQALACAEALLQGPKRPRDLKCSVPEAPKILLRNVYTWFVRIERGLYALSDTGSAALVAWKWAAPVPESLPQARPTSASLIGQGKPHPSAASSS